MDYEISRNKQLRQQYGSLSTKEKYYAKRILAHIGNEQFIDIDWDDLNELLEIEYEDIEYIIDLLFDLDILSIVDYEENIFG